jgi:Protein of unknown function (DUF2934)
MATKSAGTEKKTSGLSTAELAYRIWESEGRPHGRDQEHWARAEAEVNGGSGRGRKVPPKVAAAMTAAAGAGTGRSTRTASKAPAKKTPTSGRKKS